MHEVRIRGRLLEHFADEVKANAYVDGRFAHPIEGPVLKREDWTVAPARPVVLRGPAGIVETFHTETEASAAIDELLKKRQLPMRRRRRLKREDFRMDKWPPPARPKVT